jgi:hypothetical protein
MKPVVAAALMIEIVIKLTSARVDVVAGVLTVATSNPGA